MDEVVGPGGEVLVHVSEEKVDNLVSSSLNFGSKFALQSGSEVELEEIFSDEIEDGLSECAQEQAKVWAEAIQKGEMTEGVDAAFLSELSKLFVDKKSNGNNKSAKQGGGLQDQAASHAGVFSANIRLQPRFEAGQAARYDNAVRERATQELSILKATNVLEIKNAFRVYFTTNLPASPECPSEPSVSVEAQGGVLEESALVIMNENMMAVGFGGDDAPRGVFPAIVGRPRHKGVMVGMGQKDAYCGDEAQSRRGILTLKYPLERGVTTNWDDMEKLWHHTFYNELRVAPEEHVVVMSESQINPTANREKLCQIVFETFDVPALCLLTSAQFGLLANGRTTGVVVDLGEDFTSICAIHGNEIIPASVRQLPLGSRDLVDNMMKMLSERGYSFTTTAEREIVRDIKDKLGYVALDFESESKRASASSELERHYELPDGQVITVGSERFRATEALFAPSLLSHDIPGVDMLIVSAISSCNPHMWPTLFNNIIVIGNGSQLPGLSARIQAEISAVICNNNNNNNINSMKVKVVVSPASKYDAWVGASILSSMSMIRPFLITKEMYDESGPQIIHRVCKGSVTHPAPFVLPVILSPEESKKQREAAEQHAKAAKDEAEKRARAEEEQKRKEREDQRQANKLMKPIPNPNIIHVSFRGLEQKALEMKGSSSQSGGSSNNSSSGEGKPVVCEGCGGYFSVRSKYDATKFEWQCEFCLHKNEVVLEPSQMPSHAVVEYVVSPPTQSSLSSSATRSSLVIFCLDISGSMNETVSSQGKVTLPSSIPRHNPHSVTRMQCIQAAVYTQLETMSRLYPTQKPILITFCDILQVFFGQSPSAEQKPSSSVTSEWGCAVCTFANKSRATVCEMCGSAKPAAVAAHEKGLTIASALNDFNKLYTLGKDLSVSHTLLTAAQNSGELMKVVAAIQPDSSTALGPAVAVALGLASSAPGSKIVVCTDGLANMGCGALSNEGGGRAAEAESVRAFYTQLGNVAKTNSTQVSVLSIRGTDCKMEMIGIPADLTRGFVDVVDPLSLTAQFTHLLQQAVLGTGVSCTVRVDDRASFPSGRPTCEFEAGSVSADTDLAFAFTTIKQSDSKEKETLFPLCLSVQASIRYTRNDGATVLRVITRNLSFSSSRDDCEKDLNSALFAMYTIQQAATVAQAGNYLDARCMLISAQRMLQRAMHTREQQQCYIQFIKEGERLDGFMRIVQERSKLLGEQQQNRDDTAVRNIMQMKTLSLALLQPQ